MEINHNYQVLADNIALDKYGYIEIQGHEGRDPEHSLYIHAYKSKNSHEITGSFYLQEKHRESVKKVAVRHSVEFEELPDRETKTKVQKEFEGWIKKIKEKEMDQISHYEIALEFAKELSHGVVRGYWRNEIGKLSDIFDLQRNAQSPRGEFNVGRARLARYMIYRVGYGTRAGQSYTTKRETHYYHGDDEVGDMDAMIITLAGIGILKKVDVSNIYELTGEAFALLKEPKWHERHAELLSWVSIVAMTLSIFLMLRELGIV